MTVIWIVERASETGPTLASALMGDYAVRVFASLETFETLLRVNRSQRPDLLLVACGGARWSSDHLKTFLASHFQGSPVVLVDAPPGNVHGDGVFHVSRPVDGLRLSVFVDFAIRSAGSPRRRSVVRYRDLLLDYERLQCLVVPGDEPVSLPLKEAQLLKLFLERPGVCLSRDHIRSTIWEDVKVTPRTIDSHVCRLRKRLVDAEVSIESVYGGGYVLK